MSINPFIEVAQLSEGLLSGKHTATEVLNFYAHRIEKYDPKLNAFTYLDWQASFKLAKASDKRRAAGFPLSPLDGVPFAIKDSFEVKGWSLNAGSLALKGNVSSKTSTTVKRLLEAGMVLVGKTQMVELAYGGWGTNQNMGTPNNPWDMQQPRIPGGSSSGSATVVAAGLLPMAMGTDTGGSIRIPAALQGLTGYKPRQAISSLEGVYPLSPTLDVAGPLVRSARDADYITKILNRKQIKVCEKQPPNDLDSRNDNSPLSGVRIAAMPETDYKKVVENDILIAMRAATNKLKQLGAEVIETPFPIDIEKIREITSLLIGTEGWALHGHLIQRSTALVSDAVANRMRDGEKTLASAYIHALGERKKDMIYWHHWLQGFDAYITPSLAKTACLIEQVDESVNPLSAFLRSGNYLDVNAISIPIGCSKKGLPIGLQFLGKGADEYQLLAICEIIQQHTNWHKQHPEGLS